MLGCIANKQKRGNKEQLYIYNGQWVDSTNRINKKWFRFAILQDDNTQEKDFNNLSANEGFMRIMTKSLIEFKVDDIIYFGKQLYHIVNIDGNRLLEGQQAFARVKVNGNVAISILLRKAG